MKVYRVTFSARKVGALGVWSNYPFTVEAPSKAQAIEAARVKAYASGLEHVSLVSAFEVSS